MQPVVNLTGNVTYGGTKLSCRFRLVFLNSKVDLKKSRVQCDKHSKKKIIIKDYTIRSNTGFVFTLSMTVSKTGKTKLTKAAIQPEIKTTTTTTTTTKTTTTTTTTSTTEKITAGNCRTQGRANEKDLGLVGFIINKGCNITSQPSNSI